MSGRPVFFIMPLRQALRQPCASRITTRQIHVGPRSPLLRHTTRSRPNATPNLQFRRAFAKDSTHSFFGNLRILLRSHPIAVPTAFVCIGIGIAGLVYLNYYYQTYIIGAYHNYPEEVAKKLRRAVYFTSIDLQPQEALKYYKQALQVADEVGMDPFSDEVMGIKIQVGFMLEKIHQYHKAIELLERVMEDNLKWLELYEEQPESVRRDPEIRKKRTRILSKTVAISVKIGEHCANGAVWDRDTALERIIWSVETVEKEKIRRKETGATEALDGPWISDEEQGAILESLAHTYEEKDQHYLATPLFLNALSLKAEVDCHSIILMNNLASSLAQQSPNAARMAAVYAQSKNITDPNAPVGPAATKQAMIENAKLWAEKALDVAGTIKPPVRTEECDMGCAVAMHNLGEFAEMLQDKAAARQRYTEAVSLSRAIGFQEGVENSSARLRELGKG